MKRERATMLLKELVGRAADGDWPANLVTTVSVFGSYARGSLQPGDVDVAVDFERTDEWASHFASCFGYGRDPYAVLRMALRGRSRSIELAFETHVGHDDLELTLIWKRGEPLRTAYERIEAIAPDPDAGRAPRHAMVPAFEGLEKWLPRYVREELLELVDSKLLVVEQVRLPTSGFSRGDALLDEVDDRWNSTSVLHRAAESALWDLLQRDVDLRAVRLHGRDFVRGCTSSYVVGFGLKYFHALVLMFVKYGAVEWTEVVHPTAKQPLLALRIRPLDLDALTVRWQDARALSFFR